MSEEPRLWPVMLVAAIMVLSVAAVMFFTADNEPEQPELPQDQDMMLTYEATGSCGNLSVNGSFQVMLRVQGSSSSVTWPFNATGELYNLPFLPSSIVHGDFCIDEAVMGTAWGEKFVNRFLSPSTVINGENGVCISYRGTHTGLAYRFDLLAPDLKVIYRLVDANVSGFEELDRIQESVPDWMIENQALYANYLVTMNGGSTYGSLKLANGDSVRITCEAHNYTLIVLDEECIMNMTDGGEYQYRADWSVIGNGTREFVIEEGRFFYMLMQDNNTASADMRITLEN